MKKGSCRQKGPNLFQPSSIQSIKSPLLIWYMSDLTQKIPLSSMVNTHKTQNNPFKFYYDTLCKKYKICLEIFCVKERFKSSDWDILYGLNSLHSYIYKFEESKFDVFLQNIFCNLMDFCCLMSHLWYLRFESWYLRFESLYCYWFMMTLEKILSNWINFIRIVMIIWMKKFKRRYFSILLGEFYRL